MPETGPKRGRRLNVFPETGPHSDRLNPKSIRKLIYDVIRNNFDGRVDDAAAAFEDARRQHKNRNYKTAIKADAYYQIVRDRQPAKYMHIEAVAIYLGIPTGVLLTYTRFYAEQNELENPHGKSKALLMGISSILIYCADHLLNNNYDYKDLEYSDLKNWINLYKKATSLANKADETPLLPGLDLKDQLDKLGKSLEKLDKLHK